MYFTRYVITSFDLKCIASFGCILHSFMNINIYISIILHFFVQQRGRRYYLDFGVLSGFGSVLLGFLGYRSRRWQWLPNRNYVSGEWNFSVTTE